MLVVTAGVALAAYAAKAYWASTTARTLSVQNPISETRRKSAAGSYLNGTSIANKFAKANFAIALHPRDINKDDFT